MMTNSFYYYMATLGVGYVLGSISFAVIIAKRHGVDILKAGSGNPGATNVKRVIGKTAGNICFALDFLKGAIAAGWPMLVFADSDLLNELKIIGLIGGILGHSYSCFLNFRGGKGVAVAMGGLMIIMPIVTIIALVTWIIVFYASRYVSLASLAFGVSLPISAYFFDLPQASIVLAICVALLLIVRHRSNISRLLKGTENRFEKKS
jgi:acyl phosphate:glycerol-3-phosphate acyltransferase